LFHSPVEEGKCESLRGHPVGRHSSAVLPSFPGHVASDSPRASPPSRTGASSTCFTVLRHAITPSTLTWPSLVCSDVTSPMVLLLGLSYHAPRSACSRHTWLLSLPSSVPWGLGVPRHVPQAQLSPIPIMCLLR
jgi:hypothetical protein